MVDFRQMKQTNVEHQNHTQRDIQRLEQVYFIIILNVVEETMIN